LAGLSNHLRVIPIAYPKFAPGGARRTETGAINLRSLSDLYMEGIMPRMNRLCITLLILFFACAVQLPAQQTSGSITGVVSDISGAVVPGAQIQATNTETGLQLTAATNQRGAYAFFSVPLGTYSVAITKEGFKVETYVDIVVQGNRTTTVNGKLAPGAPTTSVTVTATPLLNKVDTTNGYILNPAVIQAIPLGTGSFTQLAVLSPGVNADLLAGSGTGAGLGNQNIWANGQRDTSNSFTFNSINSNNLFNGKTSSSVGENRFVLNTGERFLAGGQIETNTSVYDAIGQGLPTPPPETIQELRVNTSMYDASQGANSGAHIEVTTKSGTNRFHGQAYEYFQNNVWNAAPFFYNAAPTTAIPQSDKVPALHRNVFGAMFGGPIKKDKAFFFSSYQGQRVRDALLGSDYMGVPQGLTDDRSAAALAALARVPVASIDAVSLAIMQAKTPGGRYLVPSQNIFGRSNIYAVGGDAYQQGPSSVFNANQFNGNIDYVFGPKDRLSGKYYYQHNPSTSAFAVSSTLGFPQSLNAGSQVVSLDNIVSLRSNMVWEQRLGFIRQFANASTSQAFTPSDVGINLLNSPYFPGISVAYADGLGHYLNIGPSTNFANAGVFQNQLEGASILNWITGRHNISFGFNWDYGQLNVLNRENQVANFEFYNFAHFLTGTLGGRDGGIMLNGETNRYYHSNQIGAFAEDHIKLRPNLTLDAGLRWDFDGPLVEKYGRLANFYPQNYSYDLATDTVTNIGLVVAGNNSQFGTKGVSPSTLTGRQWGIGPRLGLAWSPSFTKNLVVRAGYGIYYDRGEFFTEFSPSAGLGISGPFGVTTEEPFSIPLNPSCQGQQCLQGNPFGTAAPAPPPTNLAGVAALVHNQRELSGCAVVTPTCTPTGYANLAFLFGSYDPRNTLPYSENWSLDLQWQPRNDLILTLGYSGNHGVHEVLPIPFNQPLIATPQNPVNGQIYSYGYGPTDPSGNTLLTEQVQTTIGPYSFSDGNTALRVPYIGYNPNANFWEAEGISNYNALQFSVQKRMSHGLQINGSYTWSHALDEGSGLQLFYNGNNPLDPRSGYGNAGFDRTHVVAISYLYQLPKAGHLSGVAGKLLNGWGLSGITILESGQPFSVYDFSGSVASLYFSADDYITNPLLSIKSGMTASQVQTQSTMGVNPAQPYFNANDFTIPTVQPGQDGVPPCGPTVGGTSSNFCDTVETTYGSAGRNIFRGPFQSRFDVSLQKDTKLTERFMLNFRLDAFNLFNHPSFDAPNNDVTLNPCYNPEPCYSPPASDIGFITHSLGSSRFLQMSLHLTF
jgi:Carboxypeptidase regulatory-like domain/TonB dependent receptor-like, beta-barrel